VLEEVEGETVRMFAQWGQTLKERRLAKMPEGKESG
jgi:hypothetical protein